MCGIIGTNFNPKLDFKKITNLLHHRGVDFCDTFQIKKNHFGHTRLSIIDLSNQANQPMIFDEILIVFNGEIYNYKELIVDENLNVITNSDTEVLIRLYQKYSSNFLDKLNGAFAFCIYDIKEDKFFCARDRYGKKPLYYYYKDSKFVFSSSINAIISTIGYKPKLNRVAISQYFQYFTPLTPNTFYQDINKLESASILTLENNSLNIKKYYQIKTYKKINSEDYALKKIEDTLIESVKIRLNSDVKIGSLLSGGIDSSLISALYTNLSGNRVDTFSIGYSEHKRYCELKYANITAKHINSYHNPLEISKNDFIEHFDEALSFHEEPHADSASIPLYILTKYINKSHIKSVFSGEGSDEIFLGYANYHKFLKYYRFKESLSTEQIIFMNDIISSLQNSTKESEYLRRVIKKETIYNGFGEIYTDSQKKKLFKKLPQYKNIKPKKDVVDWMSFIDVKIWLGEALLSKVDRMSMANSVETRNPFLDFNLVNLLFSINSNIKVGDTNKYLLKKIASKYIPKEIINREKKGFNSPFNEWLFDEYDKEILRTIKYTNSKLNIFNNEYIEFIFNQAKDNKFKQHLYTLFLFSYWYKNYYE